MALGTGRRALPLVGEAMVEWAVWYAVELGWRVFPVKRRDKKPYTEHGFKDGTTDEAVIRAWWQEYPTANIGLAVPEGWVVVDVDAYHDGVTTLRNLETSYQPLPRTMQSNTGSGDGSAHYCYSATATATLPDKLDEGIDIRRQGHYIILPPSIHANGKRYLWEDDYGPSDCDPQPAPGWLMALLEGLSCNGIGSDNESTDGPIFEGNRESTLLSIGGKMLHVKHSAAEIHDTLTSINRDRCIPALATADINRLVHNLFKYDAEHRAAEAQLIVSTKAAPVGWTARPTAHNAHAPQPQGPTAWKEALFTFKTGEVKQNVTNFKLILQNHPYWHDEDTYLWWDTVRVRPMQGEHEIDDATILDIADWLGRIMRLPVTNTKLLQNTIISECKKRKRDLLREWVEDLPAWDEVPRLETWLQNYAGVDDNAYTRDVSRVILVSMIARVLHPGCHYRFVAIMQGEEDIGKSLLIKAMCSPTWYVDLGLNLESKEAHMMLQGVWVAELGELHSMGNTEVTRLKSFITMDEDSYIPKYGNLRETTERRAIFIGTTNQDVFLKDTGNTRFLPIKLHGECDLEGFAKVREQLFAQAREYYGSHAEDWWDLSDEGHALAQEERELRRLVNPYETTLHDWLDYDRWNTVYYTEKIDADGKKIPMTFTPNETSWPEIAQWCLGMKTPAEWKDRSLQMQIASALRAIGWRVGQAWRNGRNMKVWRKEDETPF